jgi:hypothetical protein
MTLGDLFKKASSTIKNISANGSGLGIGFTSLEQDAITTFVLAFAFKSVGGK